MRLLLCLVWCLFALVLAQDQTFSDVMQLQGLVLEEVAVEAVKTTSTVKTSTKKVSSTKKTSTKRTSSTKKATSTKKSSTKARSSSRVIIGKTTNTIGGKILTPTKTVKSSTKSSVKLTSTKKVSTKLVSTTKAVVKTTTKALTTKTTKTTVKSSVKTTKTSGRPTIAGETTKTVKSSVKSSTKTTKSSTKTTVKSTTKTTVKSTTKTTVKSTTKTTVKSTTKTTVKSTIKTTVKSTVKTTTKSTVKATVKSSTVQSSKTTVKTTVSSTPGIAGITETITSSTTTTTTRGIPTLCSTIIPAVAYNPIVLQNQKQGVINNLRNSCNALCKKDNYVFTGGLTVSQIKLTWMCECAGACFPREVKPLPPQVLDANDAQNAQVCARVIPRPWFSLDGVDKLPKVAATPGEASMPDGITSALSFCNSPELGGCLTSLGEVSYGGLSLTIGNPLGLQAATLANKYGISYNSGNTMSFNASCICVAKGADCAKNAISSKAFARSLRLSQTCIGYVLFSGSCVSTSSAQDDRFANCQDKCRNAGGAVNRAFYGAFGVSCSKPDRESAMLCECILPATHASCNNGDNYFNRIPGASVVLPTTSASPAPSTSSTTINPTEPIANPPPSPTPVEYLVDSSLTDEPLKRDLAPDQKIIRAACYGWYRNSYIPGPTFRDFSPACSDTNSLVETCRTTCQSVARSFVAVDSWLTTFSNNPVGQRLVSVPGILSDPDNSSPAGAACWDEGSSGNRKAIWCQCATRC